MIIFEEKNKKFLLLSTIFIQILSILGFLLFSEKMNLVGLATENMLVFFVNFLIIIIMFFYFATVMLEYENYTIWVFAAALRIIYLLFMNVYYPNFYMIFAIGIIDFILVFAEKKNYMIALSALFFIGSFNLNSKYTLNSDTINYFNTLQIDEKWIMFAKWLLSFEFNQRDLIPKLILLTTVSFFVFFLHFYLEQYIYRKQAMEEQASTIEGLYSNMENLRKELVAVTNDYKKTIELLKNNKESPFIWLENFLKFSLDKLLIEYYFYTKQENNILRLERKKTSLGDQKLVHKYADADIDLNIYKYRVYKELLYDTLNINYLKVSSTDEIYELINNNNSNLLLIFKIETEKTTFVLSLFLSIEAFAQFDEKTLIKKLVATFEMFKAKIEVENQLEYKTQQINILYQKAYIDILTQIYRRDKYVEYEKNEFLKGNKNVALILFDLDKFKNVNDGYGHLMGDKALILVAKLMKKYTKEDRDFPIRYGGDEFVAIIQSPPDKDINKIAFDIAERIRVGMEQTPLITDKGEKLFITLSIGIYGNSNQCGKTLQGFYEKADEALYNSKEQGRNCINIYTEND